MRQLFATLRSELESLRERGYTGASLAAIELQHRNCDKRAYVASECGHLRATALEAFWAYHGSECKLDHNVFPELRAHLHWWLDEVTRSPDEVDLRFTALQHELALGLTTGPGSSIGGHGNTTSGYHKLTSRAAVHSVGALMEYLSLERLRPDLKLARGREGFEISPGSRVTTVRKDSSKDRVITIQPDVNVRLQGALGALLTRRLCRVGLDLSTQQYHNRRLSRNGSIDGSLATVDLSRASDTLSEDLLAAILPRWLFELVVCYTSPFINEDQEPVKGRIFLTMGNGITFPLQTAVFLAAAFAACRRAGIEAKVNQNVAVFGDDIIVPTKAYDHLLCILGQMGCEPNVTKSFSEGPFRESCGTDWFLGRNIRPFMPEGDLLESAQTVCVAYNLATAWECRTQLEVPIFKETLLAVAASNGMHLPLVPMHAPIDGGLRVVTPTTDFRRRVADGLVRYRAYTKTYPDRYLSNEGHPFVIQAVMHGYLGCPKGRRVSISTSSLGAQHVPPIIRERPKGHRIVIKKFRTYLPWGALDLCDEVMYEACPTDLQLRLAATGYDPSRLPALTPLQEHLAEVHKTRRLATSPCS